jgi:prevent-host-death family protein
MNETLATSHLYTMRELNQHTADVIREINETGASAVITRHGRFVALITPLAGVRVESAVLGAVLDQLEQDQSDRVYSSTELARQLGGSARSHGPRELFQEGARPPDYLQTLEVISKDGESVKIDVGALPAESLNYLVEAARKLSTSEIADLVNKLKRS